mmetsp:Transcript_66832/g.175218  ORF Transcript_66832/g.175218 Transcript_66832/m.175218 type:complete len:214 (+) Transcript_66832:423-1064(+)
MMCITATMKHMGIMRSSSPILDCKSVYPRAISMSNDVCVTWLNMKRISESTSSGLNPWPSYMYAKRWTVWNACAMYWMMRPISIAQMTGCTEPALRKNDTVLLDIIHMWKVKRARKTTLAGNIHRISMLNSDRSSCRALNSNLKRWVKLPSDELQSETAKYQMWGRTLWLREPLAHSLQFPAGSTCNWRSCRDLAFLWQISSMASTFSQSSSR